MLMSRVVNGGRVSTARCLARKGTVGLALIASAVLGTHASAQQPSGPPTGQRGPNGRVANLNPPKAPAAIERLGPSTLRVGNVQIDTDKKEVSVKGTVTDARILEFVAVTKAGFKGYESALELDTNAINFNLGLILIGMDQSHSVVPRMHFDPKLPEGDPMEIWVEWTDGGEKKKVPAERLIYNAKSRETLPEGPWVYTGSVFVEERGGYLADIQGALIGFVHDPGPVIESPRAFSSRDYGAIFLNPALGLKPGTEVQLTVHALPRTK